MYQYYSTNTILSCIANNCKLFLQVDGKKFKLNKFFNFSVNII